MKLIDDLRRENIAALQKELGSAKALAELLERDESQLSQWKVGSKNSGTGKPRGMRPETARYIEERTGKQPGWLDQNHGAADTGVVVQFIGGLTAPLRAWEHGETLPPGDAIFIPLLLVAKVLTNGFSQVTISLVTAESHLFDADFIRQDQLKPCKLGYVVVPDDSMRPTMEQGDRCVVDTSQVTVVDGKSFAIHYDGVTRLRRLFQVPGGSVRIEADNHRHAPMTLAPEAMAHVEIIGQLVHRSGRGGL